MAFETPPRVSTPEEAQKQRLGTMTAFSPISLSPLDAGKEYYGTYSETESPNNSHSNDYPGLIRDNALEVYILTAFIISTCIFGLLGNGVVICLLGFCIKRNQFSTYILNLSIADFGSLTANLYTCWIGSHLYKPFLCILFANVFLFMYNASQCLLTAISIDRCVSVLFPFWYRWHRPARLSSVLCALIWGLSFLLSAIHFTLYMDYTIQAIQYAMNVFLFLPLMSASTLVLLTNVCSKLQQRKRGKLLIVILLTLLFIIFAFPLNAFYITIYIFNSHPSYNIRYGFLCASLNSSINPLIYFLVGRQNRERPTKCVKAILQNVFIEEENSTEEVEISVETQL
ncbi:mas-related G-protein coupled receptor member H-like [Rhineura floridana]|uniref:mas-related G-protein coupled receptor member H-like n=1 Tax=Rhineura floridana TaxID=261503 RepID=UPI002AC85207|nr:mas-related G-protein coupled receptor member H-like [Rhineura floridana]